MTISFSYYKIFPSLLQNYIIREMEIDTHTPFTTNNNTVSSLAPIVVDDNDDNAEENAHSVILSFQGKTIPLVGMTITKTTTGMQLYQHVRQTLGLSEETSLKLLAKGKRIEPTSEGGILSSSSSSSSSLLLTSTKKKGPTTTKNNKLPVLQLLVLATSPIVLADLATKRSDPTIRGFETTNTNNNTTVHRYEPWGPIFSQQDPKFKFCRFQACTWQSFGHRPTDDDVLKE